MIADAEAVNGRKNFIIIVLKEKMKIKQLPRELRTYMRTYTYIDATKNTDRLIKRLRFEHFFIHLIPKSKHDCYKFNQISIERFLVNFYLFFIFHSSF